MMRGFKTVVLLWEREREREEERESDAITAFALFIFDSVLVIEHRQTHSAQERKSLL